MLLSGTVKVKTTMTAIPKPKAALTCLEIAKKVHIPKNKDSAMFSIKTVLMKRFNKSAICCLLLNSQRFKSMSFKRIFILLYLAFTEGPNDPNHDPDDDKGARW